MNTKSDNMGKQLNKKWIYTAFILNICLLSKISCIPTTTLPSTSPTNGFIVTTDAVLQSLDEVKKEGESDGTQKTPKIYEMNIFTNVSNRFTHTGITSKIKNLDSAAQEATFSVILPENAYISGFVMEVGGKSYQAYVKEKEEAKQEYDHAIAGGIGAGLVSASARDSNRFVVNTNVEPQSKAVFHLFYQELLQRTNGQYEIVINIHPGQPVKNLNVEVHINESRPLKFVKTSPIRTGNEINKYKEELNPLSDINIINSTSAIVKFSPSAERQKQYAQSLGTNVDAGLAGQFVVQYEIERDPFGGEVLVNDGYFVHFFAPNNLPSLSKHVVFVLDTSGSMYDRKLEQLKEAMNGILDELKDDDLFNIVEFNTNVKVWNLDNTNDSVYYPNVDDSWYTGESTVDVNDLALPLASFANETNKNKAKLVIKELVSTGGTNIYEALKITLRLVELTKEQLDKSPQPLIVFLTDGDPTVGISDPNQIISRISELNDVGKKSPIFSLSFGTGADKNFLQKLALRNLGFSRHIYEAADASLQLQNFYKEISSPLLTNVKFSYMSEASNLTRTEFPILFEGSELVVAGILDTKKEFSELPKISGLGVQGPIDVFPETIDKPVSTLERLWAYLTIKQLLEAKETASNKTLYEKKALDLALKYSFVTSVSSLVVVKPNSTNAVNTEAADMDQGGAVRSFAALSLPRVTGHHSPLLSSFSRSPVASVQQSFYAPPLPLSTGVYSSNRFVLTDSVDGMDEEFTTENNLTNFELLKQSLPWLDSVLDNDQISIPKGIYKLGLNETTEIRSDCFNSVNNNTAGNCTFLHECPEVFNFLTNADIYNQHFCLINKEFAGICCPINEEMN